MTPKNRGVYRYGRLPSEVKFDRRFRRFLRRRAVNAALRKILGNLP